MFNLLSLRHLCFSVLSTQAILGGPQAAVQRDEHERAGHELAVPLQDLAPRHLLPQREGLLPSQDCRPKQERNDDYLKSSFIQEAFRIFTFIGGVIGLAFQARGVARAKNFVLTQESQRAQI
jgi:hypothetical protein